MWRDGVVDPSLRSAWYSAATDRRPSLSSSAFPPWVNGVEPWLMGMGMRCRKEGLMVSGSGGPQPRVPWSWSLWKRDTGMKLCVWVVYWYYILYTSSEPQPACIGCITNSCLRRAYRILRMRYSDWCGSLFTDNYIALILPAQDEFQQTDMLFGCLWKRSFHNS